MQVDDLVEFLRRYGLTRDQYTELVEILSKKQWNENKMYRLLTFFRGVCKGAAPAHVCAALVSIFVKLLL